jgi:hypothetical protein
MVLQAQCVTQYVAQLVTTGRIIRSTTRDITGGTTYGTTCSTTQGITCGTTLGITCGRTLGITYSTTAGTCVAQLFSHIFHSARTVLSKTFKYLKVNTGRKRFPSSQRICL